MHHSVMLAQNMPAIICASRTYLIHVTCAVYLTVAPRTTAKSHFTVAFLHVRVCICVQVYIMCRKRQSEDWKLLESFALGLAGGDPSGLTRSKLLFDRVNLPAVINEMAVQTVLNNMDRCTKNFYMYRNPKDEEWLRLPWDMDGSFGQDNGLGGKPGWHMLKAGEWHHIFSQEVPCQQCVNT